jgi:Ca2+-binding RTX toxin-like protein
VPRRYHGRVAVAVAALLLTVPAVALGFDQRLFGTNGPDTMTGTNGDDHICGLDGDDVIDGGPGTDQIIGDGVLEEGYCRAGTIDASLGVGNDTLYSGTGVPGRQGELWGGVGNDVLVGGPDVDILNGGQGNDHISDPSGSNGSFRDYLVGAKGNDTLIGSPDGDVLSGGKGDNILQGGAGNDDLFADKGKSRYSAGAGDDFVRSRNRVRERVNCGSGRDYVNADRRDRVRGCEKRVKSGPLGPAGERPSFGESPGGGGGGGR